MALTQEQLDAIRDKQLNALAQPEEVTSGDKRVKNRSAAETLAALALIEREQAKAAGGTSSRVILVSHNRG